MQFLLGLSIFTSLIILIVGVIAWVVRRFTRKSFSKRSKKIMWASLAVFLSSTILSTVTTESETAIEKETQPVVADAEEQSKVDEEAAIAKEKEAELEELRVAEEKEKVAAEKKAEEERIAAEKKQAEEEEAERVVVEQKKEEERVAAKKKEAEEKERVAAQQKAEEEASAERLALEQKAAEEKAAVAAAASAAAASENFANCTELRSVYPSGVPKGHAAYQSKMDRDKDDFACEA